MAKDKVLGYVRRFTETGDIGGKELLIATPDDIETGSKSKEQHLMKYDDRFLMTKVDFIKRNKDGDLKSIVLSDDEEELPEELKDKDIDELEVYEVIKINKEKELPSYITVAMWLNEEQMRAVVTTDGTVFMSLPFNIRDADKPVEHIEKYTNNLCDSESWKDIYEFIGDQVESSDEYWIVVGD